MAESPERIGRYLVREIIGSGGFATVYRATDERLDADVAVKVLADNHSIDAEMRARFVEEGRRLRRARSPELVAVYDLGESDRAQPFLVLELADRGDLARRVSAAHQTGRPTTSHDVRSVAEPVAAALAQLHELGLVHRDLAPKNLLLRSTGRLVPSYAGEVDGLIGTDEQVMLSDLGLSKDLEAASGFTVAAGTAGFAPPEQRARGATVDHRADIWAASALVVWLILGTPPDGDRWRGALKEGGWPSDLIHALDCGLEERPEDRYADIGRWRAALDSALRPAVADAQPAAPTRAPGRRRGWSALPTAVLLLVLGGAAGALVSREGGSASDSSRHTETLEDGGQRTVVEDGGITVEMEGRVEVGIGETDRLTGSVHGTDTWLWVGPDGSVTSGGTTLEIEPESPGRATVRLLAVGPSGQVVEAAHNLVVPAPD
jgi:eukaryotic-like serine/threonine-protein kinase